MFANTQIQTRARLAAAHQLATKKGSSMAHDENAHGKMAGKAATVVAGGNAAPLKAAVNAGSAPLKKRSALGDVSNVQVQPTAQGKDAKSARVTAKPRKPMTDVAKKTVEAPKAVVAKAKVIPAPKPRVIKKAVKPAAPVEKPAAPEIVPGIKENHSVAKSAKEEVNDNEEFPVTKKVKREEWDDLDTPEMGDPSMMAEYAVEIFEYMKVLEVETLPNPNYMENQKELQWKMRAVLIDWLIEVHNKFHLLPETLYLTINIIDRFLSLRVVSLVKLQLVGLTSMFIASKYEEVITPSIQNFIYMADGGYSDDEVLKAERYILQVLEFNLQYPSPMSFLRRCSKADGYDHQSRTLAKYLMEVCLIDHRFLGMTPSLVAASGLYLARRMLMRSAWDKNLAHYSGYKPSEMEPCVALMLDYLSKPVKYEALFKKYSSRKFMKAAIFVKGWIEERHAYGDHEEFENSPEDEESNENSDGGEDHDDSEDEE